jgi:hypothetical protein
LNEYYNKTTIVETAENKDDKGVSSRNRKRKILKPQPAKIISTNTGTPQITRGLKPSFLMDDQIPGETKMA